MQKVSLNGRPVHATGYPLVATASTIGIGRHQVPFYFFGMLQLNN